MFSTRSSCKSGTTLGLGVIALALHLHSHAIGIDSAALEAGTGNRTQELRVSVQSNWQNRWWESNGTHIGGYWDLALGQWKANRYQNIPGQTQNLTDLSLTPVFRFQSDTRVGTYAEGGIGVHYLTDLYDNNARHLSTRFQFGTHLGVGYVFNNGWDIGAKIEHVSNGGIKEPNSGVNFFLLRVAHRF